MKISDLIEVKELTTIVQVGNDSDLKEIIDCFIWTEDVEKYLCDFATRINQEKGGGIFLKGHYGSGKSHLLSYLSFQAENEWKCFEDSLSTQIKHYPITISLINWEASYSLEHIFFKNIQIEIDSQSDIENRLDKFNELYDKLMTLGYSGFIILFDELSEFLKSKQSSSELAEDIRFLQFISEFSQKHKSWVIGAIQENIEGIGNASRETSLKLKDRFAIRWELTHLHVEEMVSNRLIDKKNSAAERLKAIYQKFNQIWPDQFDSYHHFEQIYPMHPATMSTLVGLGQLFSEHRGTLMFMKDMLNGEALHLDKAYIENHDVELIGVEQLFDYFLQRINENSGLKDYYNKVYLHLDARSQILIAEEDKLLAQRVIKCIVLSSINPMQEGITIKELSYFLLYELAHQAELGEGYIQERIINPLLNQVNYLYEEKGRYNINLKYQSYELIGKIVEQKMKEIKIEQHRVWDLMIPLMNTPPFDFNHLWSDPNSVGKIQWLNTSRDISISWGTENTKGDFVFLLPVEDVDHIKENANQVFWVPRKFQETEEYDILRAVAIIDLIRNNDMQTVLEQKAIGEAQKIYKAEVSHWRHLMETLYKEGYWFFEGQKINIAQHYLQMKSFEDLVEDSIFELLSFRHPRFREIAPKIPYYNERVFPDLIDSIVLHQQLTESELKKRHTLEAVLGILTPMGLIQKDKKSYKFVWDSQQSILVRLFEEAFEKHEGDIKKMFIDLSAGELGLPQSFFQFLIWSSLVAGYYHAYRDNEIISPGKISFQNISTLERIKKTKTLTEEEFDLLINSSFFQNYEVLYSGVFLQNELWDFTQTKIQKMRELYKELQKIDLSHYFQSYKAVLEDNLQKIESILNLSIGNNGDSYSSLKNILDDIEKYTIAGNSYEGLLNFKRKYNQYSEDLYYLGHYINDEYFNSLDLSRYDNGIDIARRYLIKRLDSIKEEGDSWQDIESLISDLKSWVVSYQKLYKQKHSEYYSQQMTAEETKLLAFCQKQKMAIPQEIIPSECNRNLEIELEQKPFCRCGYSFESPLSELQEGFEFIIDFCQQQNFTDRDLNKIKELLKEKKYLELEDLIDQLLKAERKKEAEKHTKYISFSALQQKWTAKKMTKSQILKDINEYLGPDDTQIYEFRE